MPVTITVSQVRRALYFAERSEGSWGSGSPTNSLLGQLFHDGISVLADNQSANCPFRTLEDVEFDLDVWKTELVAQTYQRFVGPRLTELLPSLNGAGPQVLDFWKAMQNVCHWFAELTWTMNSSNVSRRQPIRAPWRTLTECISTEVQLECELFEPGWSDRVRLIGIADAVVRLASTGSWCAMEFKSGKTSPIADLGQACLYQLMLTNATPSLSTPESPGIGDTPKESGALALISFRPDRHEQMFSAADLANARKRLIELIGRLAGVSAQVPPDVQPARSVSTLNSAFRPVSVTQDYQKLGELIVKTYAEYGVRVELDHPISVGSTFVRFPLVLGHGTRVQAVELRTAELQVRLRLKNEPFISRDDGRMVIDVQRPDPQSIPFDSIRDQIPTADPRTGGSLVPIGVDITGKLFCADLSLPEYAHLLVAGTTGSGKSEWLRMAIAGLMIRNTPETLRLLVIDPKRNAFHALSDSPYLLRPLVFPDESPTPEVLDSLCEEMDRRYRSLNGANSITDLARQDGHTFPRIVCICDEYRDLISRDRQERKLIEASICRLGAKARAAGIHLILATQEPSRDTIKGQLDSNMPARVGLKMGKALESNMLLNASGAQNLLGHGDLLFKAIGSPRRLQAPLLSEENRLEIFGSKRETFRRDDNPSVGH